LSELESTIFDRIWAADYDSLLGFFPARQDFEIIGLSSVKNHTTHSKFHGITKVKFYAIFWS
jgi:hypothetical protein